MSTRNAGAGNDTEAASANPILFELVGADTVHSGRGHLPAVRSGLHTVGREQVLPNRDRRYPGVRDQLQIRLVPTTAWHLCVPGRRHRLLDGQQLSGYPEVLCGAESSDEFGDQNLS